MQSKREFIESNFKDYFSDDYEITGPSVVSGMIDDRIAGTETEVLSVEGGRNLDLTTAIGLTASIISMLDCLYKYLSLYLDKKKTQEEIVVKIKQEMDTPISEEMEKAIIEILKKHELGKI